MQRTKALGIVLGLTMLAAAGGAAAFDRDSLVWKKCADCHAPTADGRIPRVENLRTTPEEWTVIVDRMRRLYGMELRKGEMDGLLKELTATQILTPEEQARVSYLQPLAQLPAGGGARRQGRGTALRDLRALPHGGQDLLVPDDARSLGEAHATSTSRSPRRSSCRCARCTGSPRPTRCSAYLAQKLPYGKAWSAPAARLDGALGRVRPRARPRRLPGRGPDHRRRQRRIQAHRQPRLRRRHLRDLRRRGHAVRRLRAAHADEEQRLRRQRRVSRLRRRDPRRVALPGSGLPHVQRAMAAQRRRRQGRARPAGIPPQGREDHAHRRGAEPARRQGRRHFVCRRRGQGARRQARRARRARAPGGEQCGEARRSEADGEGHRRRNDTARAADRLHRDRAGDGARAAVGRHALSGRGRAVRGDRLREERRSAGRRRMSRWARFRRRSGSPKRRRARTTTTCAGSAASSPTAATCRWAITVRIRCATTRRRTAAWSRSWPSTSGARRPSRRRRSLPSRCPTTSSAYR